MADKKISDLTSNPTITGFEEIPLEKDNENFKNTFNDLKEFIGSGTNVEGGNASSIYLNSQIIDGGNA
jgi:hypothetical protein